MQITFDTTTITDDEVRGLFALLDTVRPEALAVEEPEWTGVKITKRVDTHEEVSREPVEETAEKGWVAGPSDTVATLPTEPVEETADKGWASVVTFMPDTDATGLPWDERIHASSKALNADGTWRTKRGVDKALVAEVEAELRGAQIDAASETIAEVTGQVEAQIVSVEVSEPDSAGRVEAVLAVAPPAPPAPVETHPLGHAPEAPKASVETAPVAPSSAVSPFVALMKRVTTAQGAGKLTQPRVKELLESLDKKSIMDLRTDDDALASFAVLLDSEGV